MEIAPVFEIIERMSALMRSEERKKCTEFGLQSVHLQVLDYVSKCNRYSDTPAALSNYLGMTRGTVSQTLLLLEKKGYLKKTIDLLDRRVVHLSLMPEGQVLLDKARLTDLYRSAFDLLDEEALERYGEAFITVLSAMQRANNSYTFGDCKTCQYFTLLENGLFCGLTKEALTDDDSEKICQEHSVR